MARIPTHAKRVFRGIMFDVYQWEQTLFDGSTTTFEAARRVPSVQIIATTPEGKVILLREEQPYVGAFIAVPGGRVERGDSPKQAVRRELLEELGMVPREIELWRNRKAGSSIEWSTFDFIARRCERTQDPVLEPGERIEPYLVDFDQLFEESERPEFRNKLLADHLFRIRHTPGALDALRRRLFG